MIEKKTQAALAATQDKNRLANELSEIRDQVDIKDRKINVLQRKVCKTFLRFQKTPFYHCLSYSLGNSVAQNL